MSSSYVEKFSNFFNQTGRMHAIAAGVIWLPYSGMIVPFAPPSEPVNPSDDEIEDLLQKLPGHLIRWTTGFTDEPLPWYSIICRKKFPEFEYPSKSARAQIRRSFKGAEYRRVDTADEHSELLRVYRDTAAFRGQTYETSAQDFEHYCQLVEQFGDVVRYYGAYVDGKLVAATSNYVFGDETSDFSEIKITEEGRTNHRSYGLIHHANQDLLQHVKYTNNGFRSISHQTEMQSLLLGKLGFEYGFTRLRVKYRPAVRTLVNGARLLAPVARKLSGKARALLLQDEIARDCDRYIFQLFAYKGGQPPAADTPEWTIERKLGGSSRTKMERLWKLFAGNRLVQYQAKGADGSVLHNNYLIPKIPRFDFMNRSDAQIGPAYTSPDARGKGLYTNVLLHIIRDWTEHPREGRLLIFAGNDNTASLKGIEKAGFSRVGLVVKKGPLRSYVKICDLEQ